ncbi:MAG: hypothetical protein RL641_744 [Candidatus Parcubacteria bacterium]|jgi:hypothetical protein
MPSLNQELYPEIRKLYEGGFPMVKIAKHFNVTLDAVTYAMRKAKIPRRNTRESQAILFAQKPQSFTVKKLRTKKEKDTAIMGISLYWAEGHKTNGSHGVDFANSDPLMIKSFMRFLRTCYKFDEKRLRIYLYAYSNQEVGNLIDFWSNLTKIPKTQFTKPYIRRDFKPNGRKMPYGLVHIRYSDKKLLFDILKRIEFMKEI